MVTNFHLGKYRKVAAQLSKILAVEAQNELHFLPENTSDSVCKRNVGSPNDE